MLGLRREILIVATVTVAFFVEVGFADIRVEVVEEGDFVGDFVRDFS